jgi:hypothetical protein
MYEYCFNLYFIYPGVCPVELILHGPRRRQKYHFQRVILFCVFKLYVYKSAHMSRIFLSYLSPENALLAYNNHLSNVSISFQLQEHYVSV